MSGVAKTPSAKHDVGQVDRVAVLGVDALGDLGLARPQPDVVSLAAEQPGDRRPPRTRTDD